MKLNYKVVALALRGPEQRMVEAHLSRNYIEEVKERSLYLAVLDQAGWTEQSFDDETLRRIDRGWDIVTPPPRGTHPMKLAASVGAGGLPPWKIHTSTTLQ